MSQAASVSPSCNTVRGCLSSSSAAVWADIYQPGVHLSCWQRQLDPCVHQATKQLLVSAPHLAVRASGRPQDLLPELRSRLPQGEHLPALLQDMGELLQMLMALFEPPALGLRLEALTEATCPRFHVDRLGVRMVCTYAGPATQWLEHGAVERQWLGPRDIQLDDHGCGLIRPGHCIQQAGVGDALLLKGEGWLGNEGQGLVHRSPPVPPGSRRLFLSVDLAGA